VPIFCRKSRNVVSFMALVSIAALAVGIGIAADWRRLQPKAFSGVEGRGMRGARGRGPEKKRPSHDGRA
jgi:hypothetical protein